MSEKRLISLIEKGFFIKFGVLFFVVLGLALGTPAARLLTAGAHKICQMAGHDGGTCPGACS